MEVLEPRTRIEIVGDFWKRNTLPSNGLPGILSLRLDGRPNPTRRHWVFDLLCCLCIPSVDCYAA